MKTTVILYKTRRQWILSTYKGDFIAAHTFPTSQMAREFAKSRKWGVRRAFDCDQNY